MKQDIRFTPSHSMVLIYRKYESKQLLQFRIIHKNLHGLQFIVQYIYPFGRWNLPPRMNLPQAMNHWAIIHWD